MKDQSVEPIASEQGSARDQLLRVQLLLLRAWRHRYKAIIVGAIGAAASLVVALTFQRIYLSETVLLYRPMIDASALGERGDAVRRESSHEVGMRLREFLLARKRLRDVIAQFDLYPEILANHTMAEAVEQMRKHVTFKVRPGNTYHLSFRGSSPEEVQKVTAHLADLIIEQDTRLREQQSMSTVRFIEQQRERAQKELQQHERALARFLAKHPEFAHVTVPGAQGAGASIRAQAVAARRSRKQPRKRKKLSVRRAGLLALERQASRIRTQLSGKSTSKVGVDSKLTSARDEARAEFREAKRKHERLAARFTSKHPDVVLARSRMNAAKSRLARLDKAVKHSLSIARQKKKENAAKQRATLRAELQRIESEIHSRRRKRVGSARRTVKRPEPVDEESDRIVALETNWTKLNREVSKARERYLKLESQQFRASLTASSRRIGGKQSQIEVIDPANEPMRPAGLGRTMVLIAGVSATALICGLLLLILALLDDRIYHPAELRRLGIGSPLIVVPPDRRRRHSSWSWPARLLRGRRRRG